MTRTMTRFALVLGTLSALGPFAIDMYLPAMPTMARALHADPGQLELSVMSFFVGLTLGQLLYGPISDRVGRRPPILFGLGLFVAGSIACALSPTVEFLIVVRALEGLGASAGVVVGTAIIRDLYTGPEAARLMALRLLVLGVSPVVAPMSGAALVLVLPWQAIFWIVTLLGVGAAILVFLLLPETLPPERRTAGPLSDAFSGYVGVLADRRLLGLAVAVGCAQGAFYAYLTGSSFVFIENHGLAPWLFSVIFSVNAIGLIGAAQFTPQLIRRIGSKRLILYASAGQGLAVAILLAAALLRFDSLPVVVAALFVSVTAFGLMAAPATILAMRDHHRSAGTASAVLGAFQIGGGVIAGAIEGVFANGTSMPMIATIAAFGLGALAIFSRVLAREQES